MRIFQGNAGQVIKRFDPLTLCLLPLSFFAAAPLLAGPMFASADGLFHLYRLVEFDQILRSGVWYPRWAPDLMAGYGYPIFVFYAPLEFYLGAAVHALGLGYVDAIKFVVAAGMLGSAFGMYLLGRDLWGRFGGLIAATSYLYAPYRLVNTYLDGEISQTLAWLWLPWLLWACWRAVHLDNTAVRTSPSAVGRHRWVPHFGRLRTRYAAMAGLCYAGLLYTHSLMGWLTTLLLGLLLLGLLLLRMAKLADLLRLAGFLAAGLVAASAYWLPALVEQSAVQINRARAGTWDFHVNFVPVGRALSLDLAHQFQGYAGVNGPAQLGLVQTSVAILGLACLLWLALTRRAATAEARVGVLLALCSGVFFILMLRPSAPFWERLPFGQYLQFPDRMLTPLAFCLAVLSGSLGLVVRRMASPWGLTSTAAVLATLVYGGVARLRVDYIALPSQLGPREAVEYEQQTGSSGSALSEFTPVTMAVPPVSSPLVLDYLTDRPIQRISSPSTGVTLLDQTPAELRLHSSLARPTSLTLLTAFFPGWKATVNGQAVAVRPDDRGLISLPLPAGPADVRVWFGGTPDRRAGEMASLLGVLVLLAVVTAGRWPRLHTRHAISSAEVAFLAISVLGAAGYARWGPHGPAQSPASQPMALRYADGLELLGSDVRVEGNTVHTVLHLLASGPIREDLRAILSLTTLGVPWASASHDLPAATWHAGDNSVAIDLPLAGATPAGSYSLDLELERPDGSALPHDHPRLTFKLPIVSAVTLASVTLGHASGGPIDARAPSHRDFGPLSLEGWMPPEQVEQGNLATFNLWWQANERLSEDLTVSLHVVDAQGTVWAIHDDQPRAGHNPTSAWDVGQPNRDLQQVLLPPGIPPGQYSLNVGWYRAQTKQPVGPQNLPIGTFRVAPRPHADLSALNVPHRLDHSFPGGLRLIGYDLPVGRATVGDKLPLRLFWQVTSQPRADETLTVSFAGRSQQLPLPLTSLWTAGSLVETRSPLPVDAGWVGEGRLSIGLGGQATVELPETITITQPSRIISLPSDAKRPRDGMLAGAAELAGYTTATSTADGHARLALTLYWKALRPLPTDLHVFAHLLDDKNRVVAQHDGIPGEGRRPTASWSLDELIEDRHVIDLPNVPDRPLRLEVGLYDAATGQRLGDRVLLDPVSFRGG